MRRPSDQQTPYMSALMGAKKASTAGHDGSIVIDNTDEGQRVNTMTNRQNPVGSHRVFTGSDRRIHAKLYPTRLGMIA